MYCESCAETICVEVRTLAGEVVFRLEETDVHAVERPGVGAERDRVVRMNLNNRKVAFIDGFGLFG